MANEEHLAILKQGVEVWNKWREENPDIRPDLVMADLSETNLCEADLSGADLSRANLSRTVLSGVYLSGADLNSTDLIGASLNKAHLQGANLNEANLGGADLSGADLSGADLSGADLSRTDLSRADLTRTNLSNVLCLRTQFSDLDLSQAIGLETTRHWGSSTIGIDTLYKSQGKIPEAFLRGCGIPEDFITFIPSLTAKPFDFYSCFISYSHDDKPFARRVHDTLQGRGIRCWLDEKQMLPGDDIYQEVDRGIRLWDKVLLCASKHSLTSWWVDNEVGSAFNKEQQLMKERGQKVLALIPLDLDGFLFSGDFRSGKKNQLLERLAANFKGWEHDNTIFEREIERVIKALRTDGGRELPPEQKL